MLIFLSICMGLSIAIGAWFLYRYIILMGDNYQTSLTQETSQTFDEIFLFLDVGKLRPLILALTTCGVLFIAWLIGRWWAVLPALLIAIFTPRLLLIYVRKKRNNKFDNQLPDFLMTLCGAVKAGASLQQSLHNITNLANGPVAEEFSLLLREQRLGLDFQQALDKLLLRMPTESCALVVSALSLSAQTGGSLADTLENIAITLRARNHWSGRVKALTAQGSMQSIIMALLPFILLFVLSYLEPQAMSLLWHTWYGWLVLLAIIVLESIGILWIRKIANIEI